MMRKQVAIVIFLTLSALAMADIVPVVNPSFETLPGGGLPNGGCGAGCSYSAGAIPGWIDAGFEGQFRPGTNAGNFAYFSALSDGITSAYSNGGAIDQTVGVTVTAGVTYTLLVDIGQRHDAPALGTAGLLINGNLYLATGSPAAPGFWSTFTATYVGTNADAGQAIDVHLLSTGAQGNFDNIRLSDSLTSTPEPQSAALLGLALAGVIAFSRRKA